MSLLYELEKIRNPILNVIFQFFTFFGEELIVIAILCFFYWCYNKKLAYRIVFGYFLSGLLVQGLKITYRIPRPWVKDPLFRPVESAMETATGYSFPSGHTQASTALYGSLAISAKKNGLRVLGIALFLCVAFSRMYLGVHTPMDVFVSMGLSLLLVFVAKWILERKMTKRFMLGITGMMAVTSIALLIYSLSLKGQGLIEEKYAIDSCTAAISGLVAAISWYIESNYIQFEERSQSFYVTLIKYVCGLAVAVGLKFGLAAILGKGIAGKGITYAIVVAWIMMGYPYMLKQIFGVRKKA